MLNLFISDVQCQSFETCTASNGILCCAFQGQCTSVFTSCTNVNRLNPTPTITQAGVLTWHELKPTLSWSVLTLLLVATMAEIMPAHHPRLFRNTRTVGK